jgi:hypothetical protein
VQYIELYPKSRAIDLHGDAIESVPENWIPPKRLSRHAQVQIDKARSGQSAGSDQGQASSAVPTSIDVGRSPASSCKVLFKPFVGVAPRLYACVFRKDREYKDRVTGAFSIGEADWGDTWSQH